MRRIMFGVCFNIHWHPGLLTHSQDYFACPLCVLASDPAPYSPSLDSSPSTSFQVPTMCLCRMTEPCGHSQKSISSSTNRSFCAIRLVNYMEAGNPLYNHYRRRTDALVNPSQFPRSACRSVSTSRQILLFVFYTSLPRQTLVVDGDFQPLWLLHRC